MTFKIKNTRKITFIRLKACCARGGGGLGGGGGGGGGGRLNIKMSSYQYMDPHVTVLSLTWESPYLGKTIFILRRGPAGSLLS